MKDRYEAIRERYRPAQIRVLFVGESRPVNGTFFYNGDSRLARFTAEAFGEEEEEFLGAFTKRGCFLVDLCPEPVNHLETAPRRKARRAGEPALAKAIERARPSAIVVVMSAIADSVERAAQSAGMVVPQHALPFPAMGHERRYVEGLRAVVSQLERTGVLPYAR